MTVRPREPEERRPVRRILIVDDLGSVEYSIEGMLEEHPSIVSGQMAFEVTQVTSPDDIPAAVDLARCHGGYDLALVDLDFGARRSGGSSSHGLTGLRLLAEHTPATRTALYTADVEGNRELMLRAAFELCTPKPTTWISKSLEPPDQSEVICTLLDGRDPPLGHLRPYWERPDHLRLRTVCGTLTQLRLWQALSLGLEQRRPIADEAGVAMSSLDKFVAHVRAFVLDCMPPAASKREAAGGPAAWSPNLALAGRFAYANRAFFNDTELERLLAKK